MYSGLSLLSDYRRSLVAAVVLHLLLLLLLSWQWSGDMRDMQSIVPAVTVVSAALVELAPKHAQSKVQPVQVSRRDPRQQPKIKPQPEEKSEEGDGSRPSLKAPPSADVKTVVDSQPEVVELPVERAVVEKALLDNLDAEDAAQKASEEVRLLAQYQHLIRQQMHRLWKLPPGAQRQMQVWLKIRLVPTGEVVSVEVVESSGNAAFDRSALLALEKLGRFTFMSQLPSYMFERHFRVLTFKFSAEDLTR